MPMEDERAEPGLALLAAVVVGNVTEAYGRRNRSSSGGRSKRMEGVAGGRAAP